MMIPQPVRNAEIIFRGARFDVRAMSWPGHGGRSHRREMVVHPGAVVILPLVDEDHVVLIRNERHGIGEVLWELPAGTLEPDEPPDRCAAREVEEETGYRAGRIEPMTDFYTSPGICTERMWAYVARDLEEVGQKLDDSERITAEVVEWDRALAMCREGGICDGKTLAAILYHQAFGRSGT